MSLPMHISFGEPWWLLALLLPVLAGVVLWRRSGPGAQRTRAALVVRVASVLLGVTALAAPRIVTEVKDLAVAFVVDVSQSVPADLRDAALRRIESAFEKIPPGDQAAIVVFGERPSLEVPFVRTRPGGGESLARARLDNLESRVRPGESDLGRAIEFASGVFPPGCARRIVLVSDGNQTRGDLDAAVRAFAASGGRLDALPITYRHASEVMVDGVHGGGRGRVGEPFQLRAVITAEQAGDATIEWLEDGRPLGKPESLRLTAGPNVVRISRTHEEPGYHQYEVLVHSARDGNEANNVGRAATLVGGRPQSLIVRNADAETHLADVLDGAGIAPRRINPAQLPAHPAGYLGTDAVVLDNVAAYDLNDEQQHALADAVTELGVGLVVVGGDRSLSPGGYRGTPLEALLPIDLDTKHKKTMPRGALVIVLHSIEFDSGNTWAVRICQSALRGLLPTDEVGVLYYGAPQETWLFELAPLEDGRRQMQLIDGVFVGDMISFHNCFVLAESALATSQAAVKHVVVISDGDPAPPSDDLLARLVAQRVTVSTIMIQPHSSTAQSTMQGMARATGGRTYELKPEDGELGRLPQLMLKEATTIRRSAIDENPFTPIVTLPQAQVLRGMEGGFPLLRGRIVASPREGAETILIADEKDHDPLLASWQTGLGRVVAFTSDATSRWAKDWIGWAKFGPFWSQVVRSVATQTSADDGAVTVRVDGSNIDAVLDARTPEGAPRSELTMRAALLGVQGSTQRLVVEQPEPGRYVARAVGLSPGHYLVRFDYDDAGRHVQARAAAAVDAGAEHRALSSQQAALAAAASETGGQVLTPEVDPFRHDFSAVAGRLELWPFCLMASIVLLLTDVALRRLDLPWLRRRRKKSPAQVAPPAASTPPAKAPPVADWLTHAAPPPTTPEPRPEAAAPPAAPSPSTLDELKRAKDRAEQRKKWKT